MTLFESCKVSARDIFIPWSSEPDHPNLLTWASRKNITALQRSARLIVLTTMSMTCCELSTPGLMISTGEGQSTFSTFTLLSCSFGTFMFHVIPKADDALSFIGPVTENVVPGSPHSINFAAVGGLMITETRVLGSPSLLCWTPVKVMSASLGRFILLVRPVPHTVSCIAGLLVFTTVNGVKMMVLTDADGPWLATDCGVVDACAAVLAFLKHAQHINFEWTPR